LLGVPIVLDDELIGAIAVGRNVPCKYQEGPAPGALSLRMKVLGVSQSSL
jgi:hypothetical protein